MKAWGQSLENNDTLIPPHLNVTLSPMWTCNTSSEITKIFIASVNMTNISTFISTKHSTQEAHHQI